MRPRYSKRTAWELGDNPLAVAVAEARASGRALVDLTESNPTRVGLGAPGGLLAALGRPEGALYAPEPLGLASARDAVARYYADRKMNVHSHRIVLTASTSEAYGWILKLLADPGDRVLVPAPSYPLLDYLAELEDVALARYPLLAEEGFRIDADELEARCDERPRAIVLVHPNNPTGSFVRRDEAARLETIAAARGLALVVDEVFGDYAAPHALGDGPRDPLPSFATSRGVLTFVLSGLSKVCLMPQLKLGWIVVAGPDDVAEEATRRLEVIADTYLSVATPVQLALPELLAARGPLQDAVRERVATNRAALARALHVDGSPARALAADAGWYAVIEVPRTRAEDEWVDVLVREDGLVVHPGWFFEMPREGYLVVSLLPEPAEFAIAAERLARRLEAA